MNKYVSFLTGMHDVYQNSMEGLFEVIQDYDRARVYAECELCPIWQEDVKGKLQDRCQHCKTTQACLAVKSKYVEYMKVLQNHDVISDEYAEKIFTLMSIEKPDILNRKTKEILSWNVVYPAETDLHETKIRDSLIALIEEDGGLYRIAE